MEGGPPPTEAARDPTMATYDDKASALARVYAQAILQVARAEEAALGGDTVDAVLAELQGLADLYERNAGFRRLISNPVIDDKDRAASLERALRGRASDLVVDAIGVMGRKGRLGLLPVVAEEYAAAHDRLRNRVAVRVTSVAPLTEEQRSRLAAAVDRASGMTASFRERVDPSILGGLVVQIGDRKTDASVATKLNTLNAALLARASRQIQSGRSA